jgi:hypothetical protein
MIEPRIQTAVPIIGLPFPTFEKYLKARANGLGMDWTAPLIPPSMVPFFESSRVESHGKFGEKRILTIHGGDDRLVPYDQGEQDIQRIQKEVEEGGGVMNVKVLDGLGQDDGRVDLEVLPHQSGLASLSSRELEKESL